MQQNDPIYLTIEDVLHQNLEQCKAALQDREHQIIRNILKYSATSLGEGVDPTQGKLPEPIRIDLPEEKLPESSWNPDWNDMPKQVYDTVNSPPHYQGKTLEAIDIIEEFDLGFHLGNAIKYILRAGKKDDKIQDLKKAIWYLERECDREDSRKT